MNNQSHKLIVLGSDWDVYTYAFSDFIANEDIYYIPTFRPSGLLGTIQRLHLNPRINRLIPLPGKGLWGWHIVNNIKKHADGSPLCILVLENWLRMESALGILPKLRKTFPTAKIVCFAQDLITRIDDMYTLQHTDTEYAKEYSDLFITFDTNDASKYNLKYFPTVFSAPSNIWDNSGNNCGMYFLGRDKGRGKLLAELKERAVMNNLSCNFIILDDDGTASIRTEGLHYTSIPLTYRENLQNVAHCDCIVEMLQKNAASPTFRLWEAISFNKKLLTNNISIKSSPFYDERYISTFSSLEDIDWEFIKNISKPPFPDKNPFGEQIKPASLIRFMESSLDIRIHQ